MNLPNHRTFSTQFGGRELILDTGKYAKQASGSVVVKYGDTVILVTAQMSDNPIDANFLPLTVEYEERHYAIGKIPGSFMRREGRPGIQGTLNARIIDRQIRPLFPDDLRHEVQVIVTVLSTDHSVDPAPLASIGASAALTLSNIPWGGPTACVSVGYVDDQFVINPSLETLGSDECQMELIVAGSRDAVLMVEAAAQQLPEDLMIEAIERAQEEMLPVIDLIHEMQRESGKEKVVLEAKPALDDAAFAELRTRALGGNLSELLLTPGKHDRDDAVKAFRDELIAEFVPDQEAEEADELIALYKDAFRTIEQTEVRRLVIEEAKRTDGRRPDEIRPIWTEAGVLPSAHGSAVFTRGETQVLGVATLASSRSNRLVDDLTLETTEEFMLHYNFPPFSTGEARRLRGTSRRELGHGNLARRALLAVMPSQEEFPYVVRVVAETLESNGSSSMGAVCSGSMSLMDAGVPLKAPVAGIAMGLVMQEDGQYQVLSDILGSEDALGDMDFKVTGTDQGITALQMDIKISGITADIMREALQQARAGRIHILGEMAKTLGAPRTEISENAPRIITVSIPTDKIGTVIGPGGKQIRELEALGATIEIAEDGTVSIFSEDSSAAETVKETIENLTATAEVGKVYTGKVAKITDFGAFITLFPGTDGLLHISQIATERVENVEDFLTEGEEIQVKVNSVDDRGKIDLSRPELEGLIAPRGPRKPRPNTGGNRDRNNRNRRG